MKSCATCMHSIGQPDGLFCMYFHRFALKLCNAWVREPGSDA